MTAELTLDHKTVLIHEALDEAGIPHAVGGAIALGFYGEPRTTVDIDINLFVSANRFGDVARVLEGVGVDVTVDREQVDRDEQIRLMWGRNAVDLFFAYDPFHEAMASRTRKVPFGEGEIPILAPEHLIVCKAAFDRPKDWIDIEQMLIATGNLDRNELLTWLERVLGSESEQTLRIKEFWDEYR